MVQGMVKVKEKQPTKRSPTTEGEWDAAREERYLKPPRLVFPTEYINQRL